MIFWGKNVSLGAVCTSLLFTGCYTLKQGYQQARLLVGAQPVSEVLQKGLETPERLAKLRRVPQILEFAKKTLLLNVGKSYSKYISLDTASVTYIVQAAEKRRLKQKTWWFPFVGSQPYLGFFAKNDALAFRKQLIEDGYDTSLGGVRAFSMLGYVADPIYSSMLDGQSVPELAEVLIHELTHATLYVPGFSAFNENLANFVGARGAALFLGEHSDVGVSSAEFSKTVAQSLSAQKKFGMYLEQTKASLEKFYTSAEQNADWVVSDELFLRARDQVFNDIALGYPQFMGGAEKGTDYEGAFSRERLNNATVLGYALYEAHQDIFEHLFERAGKSVPHFLDMVRECVRLKPESEADLWARIKNCGEKKL